MNEADRIQPIPPRYWWLKRVAVGVLVLVAMLAGVRWRWGFVAERRLQQKIEEYRAAGEPILPADYAVAPIPDRENAAYYLRQAGQRMTAGPMSPSDVNTDPRLAIEYPGYADKLIADNGKALELIRKARLAAKCDWGTLPNQQSFNTSSPMFSTTRDLLRLGCAAAVVRHHRGDDASAIELLHDALAIGDRCGQMGLIIPYLVRTACDQLLCHNIEYLAPGLNSEYKSGEPSGAGPASRENVYHLIARLLDDEGSRTAWRYTVVTERAYQLDLMLSLTERRSGISAWSGMISPSWDGIAWAALKPRWQLQTARMLDELAIVADLPMLDWAAARRAISRAAQPDVDFSPDPISGILNPLHNISLIWTYSGHVRAVALARMAATALAIRLYELDHGRRPEGLLELVPEYLGEAPVDPFADDGRPLGYLPHAPKPILYSVGPDGVDNGGEDVLDPNGRVDRERSDMRFRLNREDIPRGEHNFTPPTTGPPSMEAVDDQP